MTGLAAMLSRSKTWYWDRMLTALVGSRRAGVHISKADAAETRFVLGASVPSPQQSTPPKPPASRGSAADQGTGVKGAAEEMPTVAQDSSPLPSQPPNENDRMREALKAVRDATDADGRILSELFEEVPSLEDYPDYFEIIKTPIDLEMYASPTACLCVRDSV